MRLDDYHKLPPETRDRLTDIAKRGAGNAEEQAFLDAHLPDAVNPCGECNLCCITPAISEADAQSPLTGPKPAGVACEYCDLSGGCRVYQSRPSICRGYMCFYTVGISPFLPKSTGICFTAQPPGVEFPDEPDAWLAVGHATNFDECIKDFRNIMSIMQYLSMGARMVVIRDRAQVVQFVTDNPGKVGVDSSVLVRKTPVDQADPMRMDWIESKASIDVTTLRQIYESH